MAIGWRFGVTAFAAACLAGGQVHAQTVQKCQAATGGTYYDSGPCEPGDRLVAVWQARQYVRPAAPLHVAPPRVLPRPRSPPRTRGRGTHTASINACQAAKDRRDAIERQVGLARTYELLSALGRDVYDACR